MEGRGPTPAERYAAIGGIVLFAAMFMHWYGYDTVVHGKGVEVSLTGWSATSFLRLYLVIVALMAVGFPVARLLDRMPELRVAPGAVLAVCGALALAWIAVRVFRHPHAGSDVEFGIFVALVGSILITVGALQTMQESGTSLAEELHALVQDGRRRAQD